MGCDITNYEMMACYVISERTGIRRCWNPHSRKLKLKSGKTTKRGRVPTDHYCSGTTQNYAEDTGVHCPPAHISSCEPWLIAWKRMCGQTTTTLCMLNGLWVTMTFNFIHYHNFTKHHVGDNCYTSECPCFSGVLLSVSIKQNMIAINTLNSLI